MSTVAVAVADATIAMLVLSLVGMWIVTQLRIWRTQRGRHSSRRVTPAVWP
jgi:hypothetical protein